MGQVDSLIRGVAARPDAEAPDGQRDPRPAAQRRQNFVRQIRVEEDEAVGARRDALLAAVALDAQLAAVAGPPRRLAPRKSTPPRFCARR